MRFVNFHLTFWSGHIVPKYISKDEETRVASQAVLGVQFRSQYSFNRNKQNWSVLTAWYASLDMGTEIVCIYIA